MPSDPTLPVSVEGVGELPDEIVRAIEALCDAEHRSGAAYFGGSRECDQRAKDADAANDALTTAILSRLTAAEVEARQMKAWAESATDACDKAYIALTAAEAARDGAATERDEALRVSAEALDTIRKHALEALASDAGWELENDKLRAERDAALSRAERDETALDFYRSAAVTSCAMEGLHYQGVSSSMFRHAWEADRAALAQPAPTEEGSHGAS